MSLKPKNNWHPSADITSLKARAALYKQIRAFFESRDVLEVETPILGKTNSPDLNICPFTTKCSGSPHPHVLQTSPEFFMKRLLCAGVGSIFQISKVFRNEEIGRSHNPEFSMLEWYRVGMDHKALIKEVDQLLQDVLGCPKAEEISYKALFHIFDINPHQDSLEQLQPIVIHHHGPSELDRDGCLDFLFDLSLKALDQEKVWVICDFPASQAALSRLHTVDGDRVAQRFEFYYQGFELANGYHELGDPFEQRKRFEQEIKQRHQRDLVPLTLDKPLLEALEHGLPDCAGVALGLDRLLMILLNKTEISQVLSFGFSHL